MHNNDIGTLCIIMSSATFKSLYGNATKRLKLPQIRKKSSEATKFHGRADSSLFSSNRSLWTPQCRLLLVDNLTQALPG